jgi:hypothetical protein
LLQKSIQLGLAAFVAATLAGCATPGSPQPPSLELPRPPDDLRATRQGDIVTLTWTQPTETTDKTRVRQIGEVILCVTWQPGLAPPAPITENCVGGLQGFLRNFEVLPRDSAQTPTAICGTFRTPVVRLLQSAGGRTTAVFCHSFPRDLEQQIEQQNPAGVANFAVEITNEQKRAAGYSNIARVPLAPTPAPPGDLRAEATKRGILISWTPAGSVAAPPVTLAGYRLERTAPDQKNEQKPAQEKSDKGSELLMIAADSPSNGRFLDTAFEWGTPYRYRVAPVVRVLSPSGETLAEVQGAWSAAQDITPQDIFPPAQPSGVQAIYTESGNQHYIDLTWLPSQEPDLAGYYVYRRSSAESSATRMNRDLLKTPSFRDTAIQPGTTYLYSVSAVDLRGNESPHSAETTETAPK